MEVNVGILPSENSHLLHTWLSRACLELSYQGFLGLSCHSQYPQDTGSAHTVWPLSYKSVILLLSVT